MSQVSSLTDGIPMCGFTPRRVFSRIPQILAVHFGGGWCGRAALVVDSGIG